MLLNLNYVVFADEVQDQAKQQKQEIKTELANMKADFINNKNTIENLKDEITANSSEVKAAITLLKDSDNQISKEKIEQIKQNNDILKSDKMKLRETKSSQQSALIEKYKDAMKSRDFTTAKSCLQEVIKIQEIKIQILEQISSDMSNILGTISENAQ